MKNCPHRNKSLGRPFICDICGKEIEKAHRKLRCWDCSLIVNAEYKRIYKTLRSQAIESAKKIVAESAKISSVSLPADIGKIINDNIDKLI